MGKSNANLDKSFDNNNENIKTIERLPQVKIYYIHIIVAKLLLVNIPM